MKILIIHNKYRSEYIGGEDIVHKNELFSLQKELGKDNVYSYEVSNDDISTYKLFFTIWFSFKYYKEILKIVQENSIDLVHVHNYYPLLTPSIFKAAKKGGAKVVHTLHNYRLWCIMGIFYREGYGICELCTKHQFSLQGIFHKCYRKSLFQSAVVQLSFWFYKIIKIFDNIDYFFVLTNFQKEKVQSLGITANKIILKPNSLQMSCKISQSKEGYIYVGKIDESKGIVELLNVWKKLDKKYKLTIIGSGDIEEKLHKEYQQNNIIFKGKCSRDETLQMIGNAKYLIQPSLLYETFGLTIIEAMTCGVPVIGFDIGTRGDFIVDGNNGFLCEKNRLKETIEKSFEYHDYEKLSENARLKAQEFDNNYIIQKQIEIYKMILGKG